VIGGPDLLDHPHLADRAGSFSIALDIERWIGPKDGPRVQRRGRPARRRAATGGVNQSAGPAIEAGMTLLQRTGLDRFNPAQGGTRGMRIIATGMLVLMAAVFLTANNFEDAHPAWGFVRAFAEAAMVGGLADWFAVTALFRHPLGLPIPHTAIIPRNKDRIGETLAHFLRENFLTPSVVARRMRSIDVAGAIGKFLTNPPGEGRLRQGASRLIADVLESLDQERLGGMVKGAVASRLRGMEVAPLLGQTLEAAITDERHVPLLDSLVVWIGRTLDSNEDMIRQMVQQRANWIMKMAGLDEKLANAIIDGLRKLSIEMAVDPAHPVRVKAEEGLADLAWRLQHDPELRAKVEAMKNEIIGNKAVAGWIDGLWEKTRAGLLAAARNPEATMAGKFGEALRQLGTTLQEDAHLKTAINQFARRAVVGAVASYGAGIVALVSDTIRGWDAKTITGRLEGAVGRDLQYIRINGHPWSAAGRPPHPQRRSRFLEKRLNSRPLGLSCAPHQQGAFHETSRACSPPWLAVAAPLAVRPRRRAPPRRRRADGRDPRRHSARGPGSPRAGR
jgi:uncharacterized membrane-anchored protein YjiN (DUF445 family)